MRVASGNARLGWYRVREGPFATVTADGNNGHFEITTRAGVLCCIASDGGGWDHVSVHVRRADGSCRVPSWAEMVFVKELFWESDEWVVQYHPAAAEYINVHAHVLHLWKPQAVDLPTPPGYMV